MRKELAKKLKSVDRELAEEYNAVLAELRSEIQTKEQTINSLVDQLAATRASQQVAINTAKQSEQQNTIAVRRELQQSRLMLDQYADATDKSFDEWKTRLVKSIMLFGTYDATRTVNNLAILIELLDSENVVELDHFLQDEFLRIAQEGKDIFDSTTTDPSLVLLPKSVLMQFKNGQPDVMPQP